MGYEDDANIDETALDVEWLEQPRLMMKYAQYAADCREEMERARDRVELVKAKLDRDIRAEPDKYGVSKPTESVVQSTITVQQDYQDAQDEYLSAKKEHDLARYACTAIEQRKSALENLVKLHGQSYFAGPSAPRDLNHERQEAAKQKQANSKVSAGSRRRRTE